MPSFLNGNCSHVLNADKLAESFCVSSCLVHPLPWRAGPLTAATFNVALTVVRIFEQLHGCNVTQRPETSALFDFREIVVRGNPRYSAILGLITYITTLLGRVFSHLLAILNLTDTLQVRKARHILLAILHKIQEFERLCEGHTAK